MGLAASPVAEHTNAGVTVSVADTTSMCGFGSDGAAALLSALYHCLKMEIRLI